MKKIILFKHFYQYILYHFYFKIAVIVIPQFWTPPQADDRIYEQPKIPTRLGLALALGLASQPRSSSEGSRPSPDSGAFLGSY